MLLFQLSFASLRNIMDDQLTIKYDQLTDWYTSLAGRALYTQLRRVVEQVTLAPGARHVIQSGCHPALSLLDQRPELTVTRWGLAEMKLFTPCLRGFSCRRCASIVRTPLINLFCCIITSFVDAEHCLNLVTRRWPQWQRV